MLALHNEVVRNRSRLGLWELMHFGDGVKQRLGVASVHSRSMRATCGMRFASPWGAGLRMTLFPRWGAWQSTGTLYFQRSEFTEFASASSVHWCRECGSSSRRFGGCGRPDCFPICLPRDGRGWPFGGPARFTEVSGMGSDGETYLARRKPRLGNGRALRPNASGASTNNANSVKDTPPAVRKATVRGMLIFSHAPGQVGLPPV